MEAKNYKVHDNNEIAQILAAIGVDLSGKKHDIGYGKIIFLTDPDVDGRHINCLLLAFFWRYMPYLFKDGRIYMVRSPEYSAWHKGAVYFGMTKETVYKQAGTQKLDIQHIKGWGEIEAVDMQHIAFDPEIRRLYRILPPKDKQGKIDFESLMGNNATYRKQLLGVD
jgi:DNA gyrase subunit B